MSDPDHSNLICREFPVGCGWIRILENLLISECSLAEFYPSLHQKLCHRGSDGANGVKNAKRILGDLTIGTIAFRALPWNRWNRGARRSEYTPAARRLNL